METQTETQDGINASIIGALKAFQRFGDAQLKELDAFDRHCSAMRDRLRYKQNQELEEFSALRLNIPLWNWLTRELELEATAPKIDESVSVNGNQLGFSTSTRYGPQSLCLTQTNKADSMQSPGSKQHRISKNRGYSTE